MSDTGPVRLPADGAHCVVDDDLQDDLDQDDEMIEMMSPVSEGSPSSAASSASSPRVTEDALG